jgi:hypothetical protein
VTGPTCAARAPEAVRSLWIGPRVSTLERVCISSFLAHGHTFELYAYGEVEGLPRGTTMRDANEILPESEIFRYSDRDSVAGFSNFFRFKLLLERGGWWVDLDVVCLRAFDFGADYVFASEMNFDERLLSSAAIRVPAGSEFARYAWGVCRSKYPPRLVWGETGPRLVTTAVEKLGLGQYVRSVPTFCPVDYTEWESVLREGAVPEFGPETYAVHLWNEMWRIAGRSKDDSYAEGCLFEALKRRFCGAPGAA